MTDPNQQLIQIPGEAGAYVRILAESLLNGDLNRFDWAFWNLRAGLKRRLVEASKEVDRLFEGK